MALVCAATLLWAAVDTLADLFADPHPAQEVVWVRYGFHLAILFAFLAMRGRPILALRTSRPGWQVVRGLAMLGMPAFFVLAATRLSPGLMWTEFWIAPLLILLLAPLALAERPARRPWLVALVAFVGVVLMNGLGADGFRWAELLPLGMAACFGAYVLLSRELARETISSSLFYTAACSFVPLTLLIPFFGGLPTLRDLVLMAAIGGLGLVFLWAVDRACDVADVSVLAPYFYLEPLWLVPLRFRLLGEVPSRATLIGGLLIVLALLGGLVIARGNVLRRFFPRALNRSSTAVQPVVLGQELRFESSDASGRTSACFRADREPVDHPPGSAG